VQSHEVGESSENDTGEIKTVGAETAGANDRRGAAASKRREGPRARPRGEAGTMQTSKSRRSSNRPRSIFDARSCGPLARSSDLDLKTIRLIDTYEVAEFPRSARLSYLS
jgi:hypothetical protein